MGMETMTYALIHGAGSDAWYWHRVAPLLAARGHDVVTMDLPVGDEDAGLAEYTDVVVDAIGDREHVVLVGQSLGGFVAPLVAARRPVRLLVLVNAMVPRPRERDWWTATKHPVEIGPDFDPVALFLHDVPAAIVAESGGPRRPAGGSSDERAVAARALAGRPDAVHRGPRRPVLPCRLAARRHPRPARDRAGRDGRRPLRRAQPSRPSSSRLLETIRGEALQARR